MSNKIDYEFSDEEEGDDQWMEFVLKFGKFRLKKLKEVVKTREGRRALTYYMTWPELREDSKIAIRACLAAYEQSKIMPR